MKKRNIPSMNNSLLFFMGDLERTEENYEKSVMEREKKIETDLIQFLFKIGVQASTKTDRYSLNYQYEIITRTGSSSFLNEAFYTEKLYRLVVEELIKKEVYKIRFYVFMEIEDVDCFGRVNYYFRYYVHD